LPKEVTITRPVVASAISIPAPTPLMLKPGHVAPGLDKRTREKLSGGEMAIEARLDLHGMTQDEAHRALGAFIRGARAAGRRCVLIVTGRGSGKGVGGGVLKNAVPRWLDEPAFRPHVLAIATAQPRDGGAGALYVMLRRTRGG
jgi:DNA-nicking Smr family endonuclease